MLCTLQSVLVVVQLYQHSKAQTSLIRFVVDLLYNKLYNKSTTSRHKLCTVIRTCIVHLSVTTETLSKVNRQRFLRYAAMILVLLLAPCVNFFVFLTVHFEQRSL